MKTPFRTLAFVFLFGCNAAQEPLPFESLQAVESSSNRNSGLAKGRYRAVKDYLRRWVNTKKLQKHWSVRRGDEKTRDPGPWNNWVVRCKKEELRRTRKIF